MLDLIRCLHVVSRNTTDLVAGSSNHDKAIKKLQSSHLIVTVTKTMPAHHIPEQCVVRALDIQIIHQITKLFLAFSELCVQVYKKFHFLLHGKSP